MTELIVDISDIKIPDGYCKNRGVYRPAKRGERFICDGGIVFVADHDLPVPRIVLIPEPQPYVWPEWCKLWGATIDQSSSFVKLWQSPPTKHVSDWNWCGGETFTASQWKAMGLTPPTRDHFTDWKTPILNPHWKGE